MSKVLRRLMAEELSASLKGVDYFILVSYDKLDSEETYLLRCKLRENKISMKVLKNSLAAVAFKNLYQVDMEDALKGQVAMAYGGDSPVELAKFFTEFVKKNKAVVIKGGYLSGRVLTVTEIETLSKVPPREVILSLLAGAFEGPVKQIAVLVNSALQNVSNGLGNLIEKLEKTEEQASA